MHENLAARPRRRVRLVLLPLLALLLLALPLASACSPGGARSATSVARTVVDIAECACIKFRGPDADGRVREVCATAEQLAPLAKSLLPFDGGTE